MNKHADHTHRAGSRMLCTLLSLVILLTVSGAGSAGIVRGEEYAMTVTPFQTSSRYDLGIDAENVRLGWRIASNRRSTFQSAYRVVVTEAGSGNTAWDSGWVESGVQTGIRVPGLKPETVYEYRVNIKDQHGTESGFSEPAWLETAPARVEGQWLSSPRLLRKEFTLAQSRDNIERARCYFGSTGFIQLRLNGAKVGTHVLGPKKSVADLAAYYNTYDVAGMLRDGDNVIGAYVSGSSYGGNSLAGMLRIYYKDGSVQTVATDGSWSSCSKSEITRENWASGEDIDASKYTGWDIPGFKENSSWSPAAPAGVNVSGGQLHMGSDAGTYTTLETFSGDYEIEAVMTVEKSIAALEFGARDGVASPPMWQLAPGSLRVHHPGWTNIETPSVSVKQGKPATLRLEIRGGTVTSYVDGKKVNTVKLSASDTRGALGIRSAVNESSSFDRITVTQNGAVIWEDNFDTADRTKWNYPGSPELRPAVSGTAIIQEYKPVSCEQAGKAYIIDFGQNMSGYVRLTVSGEKGQKYKIEYAEMLDEAGKFFPNTTAHKPYHEYKLSGGNDVFEPRFFYTGFRYIRVTPPSGAEPDPDWFTACFVSDDLDQTGFFESSDERLNQVFHMYLMAQRSNLVSNYTDCPQREKNGWTGDASVTKEAAAAVLSDWSTAEAFLDTMMMDIKPDGRPQIVVPTVSTGESGAQYDITWASAYFVFPYQLYLNTGDKYYIERSYKQLEKVFEYARSYDKEGNGLVTHNVYGDWVGYDSNQGKLDTGFLSAAYFYYCGSLLSEMLEIVGEPHAELDGYLAKVQKTLSERYFKTDFYSTPTQTANALALDLGLASAGERAAVLTALVKASEDNGRTLKTGVLGTKSIYGALSAAGYHKLLRDMTVSHDKCSFGYMIDHGATTLWEYWDKAGEAFNSNLSPGAAYWDSQNHVMLGGGAAVWMLKGLGGINNTGAGYRTVTLKPGLESDLSHVSARIGTLIGQFVSDWTFEGGKLTWDVEIPANVRATVAFPLSGVSSLYESGTDIFRKNAGDITFAGTDSDGSLLYTLGSGVYHFSTEGSAIPGGTVNNVSDGSRTLKIVLGVVAGLAAIAAAAAVIILAKKKKS